MDGVKLWGRPPGLPSAGLTGDSSEGRPGGLSHDGASGRYDGTLRAGVERS